MVKLRQKKRGNQLIQGNVACLIKPSQPRRESQNHRLFMCTLLFETLTERQEKKPASMIKQKEHLPPKAEAFNCPRLFTWGAFCLQVMAPVVTIN